MPKRHVCVSGDASLREQGVCGQGALQVDPLTQPLDMDMLHAFDAEEVDHFQPLYEVSDPRAPLAEEGRGLRPCGCRPERLTPDGACNLCLSEQCCHCLYALLQS